MTGLCDCERPPPPSLHMSVYPLPCTLHVSSNFIMFNSILSSILGSRNFCSSLPPYQQLSSSGNSSYGQPSFTNMPASCSLPLPLSNAAGSILTSSSRYDQPNVLDMLYLPISPALSSASSSCYKNMISQTMFIPLTLRLTLAGANGKTT